MGQESNSFASKGFILKDWINPGCSRHFFHVRKAVFISGWLYKYLSDTVVLLMVTKVSLIFRHLWKAW